MRDDRAIKLPELCIWLRATMLVHSVISRRRSNRSLWGASRPSLVATATNARQEDHETLIGRAIVEGASKRL